MGVGEGMRDMVAMSDAGGPGEAAPGANPDPARRPAPLVVIVTGMSGAGRTTVINALEDLGYEAINNFPLSLIDRLVEPSESDGRPIAIGIESRTRGFSTRALNEAVDMLRARWRAVQSGPISVAISPGAPITTASALAASRSRKRARTPACTKSREPATQLCPEAAKIPATWALAAESKSASSNTMKGDLPPSSSDVLARLSAEARTTWRAVSGPPVKAM